MMMGMVMMMTTTTTKKDVNNKDEPDFKLGRILDDGGILRRISDIIYLMHSQERKKIASNKKIIVELERLYRDIYNIIQQHNQYQYA